MSAHFLSTELISRAAQSSSASLHEAAGKIGALPAAIKPLAPSMRLCGPAYPVLCRGGDNLWLHRAIYAAGAGDVLIVDTGTEAHYGYWGEVLTLAARQRALAGLVIAGGIRDSLRLIEIGFPIFSSIVCIRGTEKDPRGAGTLGQTIRLGMTPVARGDLVFGDADGVVVVPASRCEQVITNAFARDREEVAIMARLQDGESTLSIYDLPPA